jgi:hypothetical protein
LNTGPCDARNAAIFIRMRSVPASETQVDEHQPLFDVAAGQALIRRRLLPFYRRRTHPIFG